MNYKFTIVLSFILSVSLCAQSALQVTPKEYRKQYQLTEADVSYEEQAKFTVTNTGDKTLQLRWDKDITYLPLSWESQVCDKESSYPQHVMSNVDPLQNIDVPVELVPGESFDFYLTILPYNTTGQCAIDLPFRSLEEPDKVLATARLRFTLIDSRDSEQLNPNDTRIRVYPNPVIDRFFLTNTPTLSRLEIYNSLGRRVRSFDNPQAGDSFDVSTLPQGVYLVSLIDKNGKSVRTLRLLRRAFRP